MEINWYPGQMARAKAAIISKLKYIDLVIEVRDCRIPESSKNPELEQIISGKKHLLVLNKKDLAQENATRSWETYLHNLGLKTVSVSATKGFGFNKCLKIIKSFSLSRSGLSGKKPFRAAVLGIPNVGKSSFINRLSRRSMARTGNRPGVTRGEQWIKLPQGIELLDTPGLLWPKLGDREAAVKLALTGAIKYELLDDYALALRLLQYLISEDPAGLKSRFGEKISVFFEDPKSLLQAIGTAR
ncbi:MAG TPA: ribosome biogenesis GTPase YlqF, partial [Firmicutes bacterium]|nr:ribosome biogenesis GTPase YlqF [Bacillota bacterium]